MRKNPVFWLGGAVVVGLTLLALVVVAAPDRISTPAGTVRVALASEPKSLDPHVTTSLEDFRILANVYEGLVRFTPGSLEIEPALGPGLRNTTLAIAIVNVPFFARSVRGATLSIVQEEYVAAARATGATSTRVMTRHVLPNVMPVVIVAASTSIGWMIVETAGLSFLGLGAQPPTADLGGLLGQSRHLVATAPHVALVPGLAILGVVIALNLVGDGLRQGLDPKLQKDD